LEAKLRTVLRCTRVEPEGRSVAKMRFKGAFPNGFDELANPSDCVRGEIASTAFPVWKFMHPKNSED
jgi:hypothetical protein